MAESFLKEEYKLERNPFPPAATGIDLEKDLYMYIPAAWNRNIEEYYSIISTGTGVKAFPIIGDYGSGKTAFLKGYLRDYLLKKRIKPFYFENPGVRFYDLANTLLRNLVVMNLPKHYGRSSISKR